MHSPFRLSPGVSIIASGVRFFNLAQLLKLDAEPLSAVFIAHFEEHDYYPGGTKTLYALVGGLSVCSAMLAAPLANYLAKSFHYRVPLLIGLYFSRSSGTTLLT